MPKVRDLGVTVVPEQFGPMEMGPGGFCNCTITNPCIGCTQNWTFPCRWFTKWGCGFFSQQCTDCTLVPFSICGTTPGPVQQQQQCTDCTQVPFSICGTTPAQGGGGGGQCTDCTLVPFSICGTTPNRPGSGQLDLQSIQQLKTALQQQLQQLEEAEKNLGPQALEQLDAREKELTEELDRIKSLRQQYGKKK
ncbi:MAG TPA: hypothetical protein VG106_15370 [Vicinamibacterales bacterium]|nr:hypothetical protein [Vicinamibacterales bacterium]